MAPEVLNGGKKCRREEAALNRFGYLDEPIRRPKEASINIMGRGHEISKAGGHFSFPRSVILAKLGARVLTRTCPLLNHKVRSRYAH